MGDGDTDFHAVARAEEMVAHRAVEIEMIVVTTVRHGEHQRTIGGGDADVCDHPCVEDLEYLGTLVPSPGSQATHPNPLRGWSGLS